MKGQASERMEEGPRTEKRRKRPEVMAEPHLCAPPLWGEVQGLASVGPSVGKRQSQLGRPIQARGHLSFLGFPRVRSCSFCTCVSTSLLVGSSCLSPCFLPSFPSLFPPFPHPTPPVT